MIFIERETSKEIAPGKADELREVGKGPLHQLLAERRVRVRGEIEVRAREHHGALAIGCDGVGGVEVLDLLLERSSLQGCDATAQVVQTG